MREVQELPEPEPLLLPEYYSKTAAARKGVDEALGDFVKSGNILLRAARAHLAAIQGGESAIVFTTFLGGLEAASDSPVSAGLLDEKKEDSIRTSKQQSDILVMPSAFVPPQLKKVVGWHVPP
ncbi:hypothetical protein VPNG_02863 [Cytospora leucostoma]|uniref:Uncharacterized protein n=1 Tax=Cytospora leucostoma TaxID=1230097 RepID=A0A423XJ06_9PEZI|nr:hypothetical protein VPNG_02863 [Cytospora leucostoma]